MNERALHVSYAFALPDGPRTVEPYGNGHINDTYLTTTPGGRFILQRLNRYVFKRPDQVMENIRRVTLHLAEKIRNEGGDPLRQTLTLMPTLDGRCYHMDADCDYWRVYRFVEHTVSFDLPDSPALFGRSGERFGWFQCQLADFPAAELYEAIPHFHDTPDRFRQLLLAIDENRAGRKHTVQPELAFALRYETEVRALIDANLPLRVTHNDTKLNNILMDAETGEGVCVIDLDTVMPGLAAYDFGDSIRFGANTAAEDETDLSNVALSLPMFEAYTRGYLSAVGDALTEAEIALLPMGAKLMTLECGLRFLTDHLNGDVYFKVHRENHNLDRARNQFALVRDMELKWDEMHRIVRAQRG